MCPPTHSLKVCSTFAVNGSNLYVYVDYTDELKRPESSRAFVKRVGWRHRYGDTDFSG